MLSFDEACEQYRPLLLKLAQNKVGCLSTAEDVVQDTLISAWRSNQGYFNYSFFVTILHRRIADHFRHSQGRRRRISAKIEETQIIPFENAYAAGPTQPNGRASVFPGDCLNGDFEVPVEDETPLNQRFSDEVIMAFRDLPEKFKEAAILILLVGATYEEAAAVLNIPVGTVFSRVNRVRLILNQNKELKSLCRAA